MACNKQSSVVRASFNLGQPIKHCLYGYEGVIVDVDAVFSLSDEWYQQRVLSGADKQQPWYLILVKNSSIQTYVAESCLIPLADRTTVNQSLLRQISAPALAGLQKHSWSIALPTT